MGKIFKKSLAMVLTAALIVMCIPMGTFAEVKPENSQNVITGATHDNYPVSVSGKTITVTVPYNFSGTVNIGNINPVWDSSVNDGSIVWGDGYDTVAVGESVAGTVMYKVGSGEDTYVSYYLANVDAAAKKDAEVKGSLNKSVMKGNSLTFTANDFKSRYEQNDGNELAKIVIANKPGSESNGSFKVGEDAYTLGNDISYTDLSKVSYTPSASGTDEYVISYYESGNDTSVGTAALKITVENPGIPDIDGGSLTQKETKVFPVDKVNTKFKETSHSADGFDKIVFTELPASSKGTLYTSSSKETAASANTAYEMDAFINGGMVFVPKSDYTGNVDIKYSVYDGNERYNGKVSFTVLSSDVADIKKSITTNETYSIPYSTINTNVKAVSGNKAVDYVLFTNASSVSKGSLYYNGSSKITSNTVKYYYSGSSSKNYLSKVSFVPSGSTGTSTIKYRAYTENGEYYDGEIVLTITESSSELPLITYNTDKNKAMTFSTKDFKTALSKKTDKSLDYVKFELPSTSKGELYYDYETSSKYDSKVSVSTKYYASGSGKKLISKVTFVPKSSYTGNFNIKYTAYSSTGTSYSGEIKINVRNSEYSLSDIEYKAAKGTKIVFDTDDFKKVLADKSNENLNYVKFELPSSSYGTLYYDYSSSSNYDSEVSSGTKYYRTGSGKKLISKVTFVPKSSYTGTVTVNYTAYDNQGESFEGSVVMKIGTAEKLDDIAYKVDSEKVLKLSGSDINKEFKEVDGSNFSYVKFTLPSSTFGYLYHDYVNSTNSGSFVKANDKFYRTGSNEDLVDEVTFEPNSNFSGTFSLKYTAYGSDDASYEGVIKITVEKTLKDVEESEYFIDVKQDYSWAAAKIDYLYKKGIVKGIETTSQGMKYGPAENIKRGDFMLMLDRSFGFNAAVTGNFEDVPKDSYYYDAIGKAKALGIAQGAYGKFNPEDSLTREDAMVLLYRAMNITGKKTLSASSDISKFADKAKISDYAVTAVGTLVKAGVIKGYEDGTFNPQGCLTRAEMAVVLYNVEML